VSTSELDEISDSDSGLCCDVSEVETQALKAAVLCVGTFARKDEAAVTRAVEAVVEGGADSSAGGIGALSVREELRSEGCGDLVPDRGTCSWCDLFAEEPTES
jgi:hypothetical protein